MVDEPCAYILFPEDTRSRDGAMTAFKPGLGMLVAGADVPVVPCRLEGCYDALRPEHRVPRPRRIRLRVGEPLNFASTPNSREGWVQVACETEAAVRALSASTAK